MKPFPGNFTIVRPETWSEKQRGWQKRRPAAQSKLRELRLRARYACFVLRSPYLYSISVCTCPSERLFFWTDAISILYPSNKRKGCHADPHTRREDRPQSSKAGHQSGAGGKDIVYQQNVQQAINLHGLPQDINLHSVQ